MKYLNDCPVQPNLPVYLLVAGAMGLVRALNLLWKQFRRRRLRKLEGVELDQEEETETSSYLTYRLFSSTSAYLVFRWIWLYGCCFKPVPFRLVHRWTVLDVV